MSGRINKEKLIPLIYFMSSILVGSLFLVLPISSREGGLSYLDALFEATSAVCVTGLAVVDTTTLTRFGQTIILVLIQLGGLGIVTFTTLYLFMPWRRVSMTTHGMIRDYTLSSVEYRTRRTIREIIAWTAS
ncbi:MAG TPA: potassium transporter TrkG, partial [Rectinema sp.]|nr:potassium transporter TrkG [Rectinema sp.]